jgi:hypothetical protein
MFSSASLAGAFSGLLAAAIQKLHAKGKPGWAWIFILVRLSNDEGFIELELMRSV